MSSITASHTSSPGASWEPGGCPTVPGLISQVGCSLIRSVLLDPLENVSCYFQVLPGGLHVLLLPDPIGGPDPVAKFLRQGEPVSLAPPHGRGNLFRTPRPVALMIPVLLLPLDVLGLDRPLPGPLDL